ncbi:hypothetical protein LEP1GSC021_4695 [Leptospira noguchii str. 1993005606]|uniref:Uncharacterized protein n=2 Tax=Leptospira noguchii TaxID=28182 RepID=M6YW03_9LEPT|nr:hypothetical protein LEP1GSC035_1467 [Leptospira noguchii str. 2007001578]EMO90538.1 hypothetical protein LEP1GSC024_3765 [Leptospira noguchii str. 2001034031]EPE83604.1 hypothetical protein LEP1GSC021_4695 [Leptospira noguchii str. 1993005606]
MNTLINWKKYLGFIEGNSIQFKGRNFFCLTTSKDITTERENARL